MNERFENLAEQAMVHDPNAKGLHTRTFSLERFAELIVRECADLFEVEWGDEKLTGNDVGWVVKRHFGVEQ